MELRCPSKILHAHVFPEQELIEITCKSRWCGKRKGVVVVHRYNMTTGKIVSTQKYKDPEEGINAASIESISVRTA